jgi:hypothetical protein
MTGTVTSVGRLKLVVGTGLAFTVAEAVGETCVSGKQPERKIEASRMKISRDFRILFSRIKIPSNFTSERVILVIGRYILTAA